MAMRSDMEQYYKGVAKLENWELSQMGGIRRRRGMRKVCTAVGAGSKLVPYVYSYAEGKGLRYVVEVGAGYVRVLDENGTQAAMFRSGQDGAPVFRLDSGAVRFEQVRGWLFLTCLGQAPLVLELEDGMEFVLKRWEFEQVPWKVDDLRDSEVSIRYDGGDFAVEFAAEEADNANGLSGNECFRASFWTEEQEVVCTADGVLGEVEALTDGTVPAVAEVGDKFAVPSVGDAASYWVCKQEFPEDVYVEGLDDPGCYPDNFERAESMEGFTDVARAYSVKDFFVGGKIAKGAKLAIRAGYWEYWTCVKRFVLAEGESMLFRDYPDYFVRGVAVGRAMPCRGEWKLLCSGLWYGSYEVRRNYETEELNTEWEPRGSSFSRVDEASNTVLSGTEADEVCYVRLFLTRSRRLADGNLLPGFPADSCGNRLVVEGYRHDMTLGAQPDDAGYVRWSSPDKVRLSWTGERRTRDWSWAAFGARYGWPMLVGCFQGRLVFAATESDPQKVWLSRVDDLNNFASSAGDAGGFAVELTTETMDPICWIQEHDSKLMIGTTGGEYVLQNGSSDAGAVTAKNAYCARHGHVGSLLGPAWMLENEVVYVERGNCRVRVFRFWLEMNGYRSEDLSVFAPHVLRDHGGVVGVTALEKPERVLVFALGDGQVALCVYNQFHQVMGWHRWVTDGRVLSVCGMPAGGAAADRLWLVVEREKRAANGAVLGSEVNVEVVDAESPYVDAGGRDYVSAVRTNDLLVKIERRAGREAQAGVVVRFGGVWSVEGLRYRYNELDGWQELARFEEVLQPGWFLLPGAQRADFEHWVELEVRGERACEVLAIQG